MIYINLFANLTTSIAICLGIQSLDYSFYGAVSCPSFTSITSSAFMFSACSGDGTVVIIKIRYFKLMKHFIYFYVHVSS